MRLKLLNNIHKFFNMKKPITIFFCIILFVINIRTSDSKTKITIEHLSSDLGISGNLIYCMMQDSKGFLWFGTMFGLVRFDGREYKTYRYDPSDTNSLSNDDIISLCEDNENNIWAGTFNGGLNKFDRHNEKFTRFVFNGTDKGGISSNTIWTIFRDSKEILWFGTEDGGLNKFENGKFTVYKMDSAGSGGISGNNVRCITEDHDGFLWIGTIGKGLNRFDRNNGMFVNYRYDSLDNSSLNGYNVYSVFTGSDGDLWIGTGRGLCRYNREKDNFTGFQHDSLNPYTISNDIVFSIQENDKNNLLVGTGNGLNEFDKSTGRFSQIKIYPDKPEMKESIVSFLKDKSGVIWTGIYYEGLHKIYQSHENFKNLFSGKNVKCIFKDSDGNIYAGTSSGLVTISSSANNYFIQNPLDIEVNSLAEDNSGNIWIGSISGLIKYSKKTNTITKFHHEPGNENSLSSNNILKIYTDKSGGIWIGTDNGLNMLDESANKIIKYLNIPGDESSLSENTVLSLYEDSRNSVWVGTYKGLNKLDRETGKFTHFSQNPSNSNTISNNYVFSFCEDSFGNFWIGTGGGLNIFDRDSKSFFHFTEKDGLPNSVISGIAEDKEGNLWLSTYYGISKFNIKERKFRNFNLNDGLHCSLFNTGSYFRTIENSIYFGGINGAEEFNPGKFEENILQPGVLFTTLTKFNGTEKIQKDISLNEDIQLNYDENNVKIKFSSSDFLNPGKSKFRFILEGFDKEWTDNGISGEAVYTNLNPGNYTFRVKSAGTDGLWNEKESFLRINIKPPFWKTIWFYVLISVLLLTAVIFIQNYRVRKKVKYLLEIENIKEQERELMREQASRDYHDELGHKLTRISLYSRRVNRKLSSETKALQKDLNSIVETSNSLQSGAKDLIWAMNPKEDSLYDFTVRLRDFGNELFENTGISFNVYGISDNFRKINLSMNCKRHLMYIFKEGMNNIMKYASCSKVNLSFNSYDDDLEILLEDNGRGFDMDNCLKGYGLKNIFSRSKQININVNILSEPKAGTKITLKTNFKNLVST